MRRVYTIILAITLGLFVALSGSEAYEKRGQATFLPKPKKEKSSLSPFLKLKGTIFTSSPDPLAIIEDTRDGRVSMYEIGDTLDGVRIIDIIRGEVVFKTSNGEDSLSFPIGAILQADAFFTGTEEDWYNIRREGDTFVVDKDTISKGLRRIREVMRNVRLKPCFTDGKGTGIKVTKLTPIGVLKELGVQEGDIIKGINGLRLNSPHHLFTAYRKLKNQRELKVEIIRDNTPLILTYKIERGRS